MKRLWTIVALYAAAQVGAGFVFRRRRRRYAGIRRHFLVTQGGSQVRPTGEELRDAVVSVFMGGLILDMRSTQLVMRPARLDLLCVMGGVELVVPEDWRIQVDVDPAMGGVQDRREATIEPGRPVDLMISGRLVMGGLDITSTPPERLKSGGKAAGGAKARQGVG